MKELREFISGKYTRAAIEFHDPEWHNHAKIPSVSGWYYIETNAPFEILARQTLSNRQYTTQNAGKLAAVKNYDLKERCDRIDRFDHTLAKYLNDRLVYSGLSSDLKARAHEHVFGNLGTGALALSKHPELHEFEWHFCYRTLDAFMPECPKPRARILLLLGEQMWRSENGWPILCAA